MTQTMCIDKITVGPRFRQQYDIEALAAWIAMDGLLQPIIVSPDGCLLDGHRRLLACRQLGWIEIPVFVREERQ